jgi:hypothetical protein
MGKKGRNPRGPGRAHRARPRPRPRREYATARHTTRDPHRRFARRSDAQRQALSRGQRCADMLRCAAAGTGSSFRPERRWPFINPTAKPSPPSHQPSGTPSKYAHWPVATAPQPSPGQQAPRATFRARASWAYGHVRRLLPPPAAVAGRTGAAPWLRRRRAARGATARRWVGPVTRALRRRGCFCGGGGRWGRRGFRTRRGDGGRPRSGRSQGQVSAPPHAELRRRCL